MKKANGAVCVLCGKFGETTREHVPPKALFLKPRPQNTITVRLCEPCNNGFKKDDEYFRILIAINADQGTTLARLWTEKVVNRTLHSSPKLKSMLAEDRERFQKQNEGRAVRTSDGQLIEPDRHHLLQPMNAERINGVITKIVRCLHFHTFGERLSSAVGVNISTVFWTEDDYWLLKHAPTGGVGMEGEFLYRVQELDERSYRWLLSFYDKHHFDVIVGIPFEG